MVPFDCESSCDSNHIRVESNDHGIARQIQCRSCCIARKSVDNELLPKHLLENLHEVRVFRRISSIVNIHMVIVLFREEIQECQND